jgi:hypothetical protein
MKYHPSSFRLALCALAAGFTLVTPPALAAEDYVADFGPVTVDTRPLTAPTIVQDPRSVTNLAGTTAAFSVQATGTAPLAYQWRKDGLPLADGGNVSGAGSNVLTLANVQGADAGQYAAVVTNALGSVTSAPARLRVFSRLSLSVSNPAPARFDFTNVDWVEIVLTAPFPNALIFYTLDGSPPSAASSFYSGPLIVSDTVVLRAIAYNPVDFSSVEMAAATVNLSTTFRLVATATSGGTVVLEPPGGSYLRNTAVTMTAVPDTGWEFLAWSGDTNGNSNPLTLVMDGDKTVTAHFGPRPAFTLVVMTAGGGTVSGNTQSNYYRGETVNLTAELAPAWSFLNWMGDASGTNPQISVTMDRPKAVQAVFGTECKTSVLGLGTVARNFGAGLVPYGGVVRLTAIPQPGYYLALWGNAASSVVNPLDFTVTNANPTVGAFFLPLGANQATLTVQEQGAGVVVREPQANAYTKGQVVQLTAQPFPGQDFLGWAGDASGTQNPLAVTATNQTITALFSRRLALAIRAWPGAADCRGSLVLLAGGEGDTCLIQTAPDLADWQPLTTLTVSNTAVQFIDVAVTNRSPRFYRGWLR